MQNRPTNIEQFAARLVQVAIEAADPGRLLSEHIIVEANDLILGGKRYNPSAVLIVSVGKAAVSMAKTAAQQLGSHLSGGIVISKAAEASDLPPILHYYQGSHPVPDQRSLEATAAVQKMLANTTADQLVLCLISGGASALLTQPILPLPQWQALNQALLASGCTINHINTVRQLFDPVKGGGLAQWAAPAPTVSLILSDVIGSQLEHIGSGPTVPTRKEPAVVKAILDEFNVWQRLDQTTADLIRNHLQSNPLQTAETPPAHHLIIGDVSTAAKAVARQTAEWRFQPTIVSTALTGEAREIGQMAAEKAQELQPDQCLIWGGESTVAIRGKGRGGRNQEIALAAALALKDAPNCVVIAFSTDAEDGPMPVAGAVVSGHTAAQANAQGLDAAAFLANNDSYTFFERLGQGHLTAERGTNVNDILIALKLS